MHLRSRLSVTLGLARPLSVHAGSQPPSHVESKLPVPGRDDHPSQIEPTMAVPGQEVSFQLRGVGGTGPSRTCNESKEEEGWDVGTGPRLCNTRLCGALGRGGEEGGGCIFQEMRILEETSFNLQLSGNEVY